MKGSRFTITAAFAALALSFACSRQSASPTSPSSKAASNDASADGSTLKVSAPTPTSPINNAQAADNQPTLTASASRLSQAICQYALESYSEISEPARRANANGAL